MSTEANRRGQHRHHHVTKLTFAYLRRFHPDVLEQAQQAALERYYDQFPENRPQQRGRKATEWTEQPTTDSPAIS